jgi:peptidoglycan/LPS O-acetylase OafA/YrhL
VLSQAEWDTHLASLVLVGDASYILYLIHPYCEYSLDRLFASHFHWLKRESATGAFIGVSVSIVLAVVVHLYGERPTVRFLNSNFGGKRKSTEFAATA